MLAEIEQLIEQYFPEQWTTADIDRIIGGERFERDVTAANETLNRPLRDFLLRGGKRMRPMLFLTLLQGFNKDPKDYLDLALLIELAHNATLIIDDIEDLSQLRRGKPALHISFGEDVAINAGVALHFLPLNILLKEDLPISESQRLRLFRIYTQELNTLYFGQATDIYWHKNLPDNITRDKYFEMCRMKTGTLMRMAARFAVCVSELDKSTEQKLINFTESAGIAFQIEDDILDLTADEAKFGKPHGNDISEGKISLPVILALEELDLDRKEELKRILFSHTHDAGSIETARETILSTKAISQAGQYAEDIFKSSWSDVKTIIPSEQGRTMLEQLYSKFIHRDR